MVHDIEGGKYLTIAEAVAHIGCTDGWVRHLIRTGQLEVRRLSERVQLVPLAAADRARDGLTTRANAKRHLAKRPAAKRKTTKKAAKRRSRG